MSAKRKWSAPKLVVLVLVLALGAAGAACFFGGTSYMIRLRSRQEMARVHAEKPKELLELRASELARLSAGPMSIDAAMQALETRGRMGLGSALEPKPSNDPSPLMGWTYTMRDVPEWMLAPPADAGSDAPADAPAGEAADAGASAKPPP